MEDPGGKMLPAVALRVLMLCPFVGSTLLIPSPGPTPLSYVSGVITRLKPLVPSASEGHNNMSCPEVGQVNLTSASFEVTEGDDITMECEHNLPPKDLKYKWMKNNVTITDEHNNNLTLTRLLAPLNDNYSCSVISFCGTFTSMTRTVVVKDNSRVILVVCAVLAVVFILVVGVSMKFFLKRENVNRKVRMEMRNQQINRGS